MSDFQVLTNMVMSGDVDGIGEMTQKYVDQGNAPLDIIEQGLMKAMQVVAVKFKAGDMFVPEVMMSANAMNTAMKILKPLIVGENMPVNGVVVIGAVKSDLHDIGKNLVKMMLESSGFKVIDAGIDVPAETFVSLVEEHNASVLGLAALLTTTMSQFKVVMQLLEEKGLRKKVKVLIGGAPVTAEFAKEIQADGYAPDAGVAVEYCRQVTAR